MFLPNDSEMDSLANAFKNLTLQDCWPVSRMTSDLLYQFFLLIAPSSPADKIFQNVLLSHVSREWRRVILGAPLMWTYVTMVVSKSKTDHSEVVQSFLRRSQLHPVSFHLSAFVDMEFRRCEVTKAICGHAHRFQAVHVLVDKLASLTSPLDAISSFRMPRLRHFDLAVRDVQRCTILMTTRTKRQWSTAPYLPFTESPTQYLDWSLKRYTLTMMSLKYLDLTPSTLLPILIMTQHSLAHLELFNDNYDHDEECLPCVCLPNVVSFSIGYRRPRTMLRFVKMIDLPNLQRLSVRDLGRCGQKTTPKNMIDSYYRRTGKEAKDCFDLLLELCPFKSVIHLKLHGVTCPTTPLDELLVPLQHLFSGLESLSIILCDDIFLEALIETTLLTPPERLVSLSELTITSEDYSHVLQYLALRAARGLPVLKLLSVNPRISLLRHFYSKHADSFHVMNRKMQNAPEGMCW